MSISKYSATTRYMANILISMWLMFTWNALGCGEVQNVSILGAIWSSEDGCWEIIGAAEGMNEDKES